MSKMPFFTVLLPTKSRPNLIRESLLSILGQSFNDFEVIVSNNGADPEVTLAIADLIGDSRVSYVEQDEVLCMPEHWEKLSSMAQGEFLTVLTDRSVLRQGGLQKIHELHQQDRVKSAIVTWAWDLYYDEYHLLLPQSGNNPEPKIVDSTTAILDSMKFGSEYPTILPRGLNSSVSVELIAKVRKKAGAAFSTINPDFSFAYSCLMIHPHVTFLDDSLMISQGLGVSNGGNAYRTDASAYVSSLNMTEPIKLSPIKTLFVENIIAEDFYTACDIFSRDDLLAKFDVTNLYLKCLAELHEKKYARELSLQKLEELEASLYEALSRENDSVRHAVEQHMVWKKSMSGSLKNNMKKIFASQRPRIAPLFIRYRGGKHYPSALSASGISPD